MCSRGVASPIDVLNKNKNQLRALHDGPNLLWSNAETEQNKSKEVTGLPETNKEIKKNRFFLNKAGNLTSISTLNEFQIGKN